MSDEQLEQAIEYNNEMLEKRISEDLAKEDILNLTGSIFDTFLDYVDNSNNELEDLQQENQQLQNNWNELKNWLKVNKYSMTCKMFVAEELLEKMQELEQGKDENN